MLKENNERDRILSPDEYVLLLAHGPDHVKAIVKVAYHTAMRHGEILNLKWDRVDLIPSCNQKVIIGSRRL